MLHMNPINLSLSTKKESVKATLSGGYIIVRLYDVGQIEPKAQYRLLNLERHVIKLSSYKTLNAIVKYAQANDSTENYLKAKQITAELKAKAQAEATTVCPDPVPNMDGATIDSTPTAKPLSNGVPISQSQFAYDDLLALRLCVNHYLGYLTDSAWEFDFAENKLINDIKALKNRVNAQLANFDQLAEV